MNINKLIFISICVVSLIIFFDSCKETDKWIIGNEYREYQELTELNGYNSSGSMIIDKVNFDYSIEMFSKNDKKVLLVNKILENGKFKIEDYLIVDSNLKQNWTFNNDTKNYVFIYHVDNNNYIADYAWEIVSVKKGKWKINNVIDYIQELDGILNSANID